MRRWATPAREHGGRGGDEVTSPEDMGACSAQADEEMSRMAFELLKAQISLLVSQMENRPEDKHELYLQLRERLNEIRSMGMPVPDDLVRLERELEAEFTGEAPSP